MLTFWIVNRISVRRAHTRAQKEAIFRLRYRVYVEELKKTHLPGIDHQRRWLRDPEDDRPDSFILYTGQPDQPVATLRNDLYRPGQAPEGFRNRFSLDRFPELDAEMISESTRMVVSPEARGRLHMAALALASYRHGAVQRGCRFGFAQVVPALVNLYRRLGMRLYAGRLISTGDGIRVPMMAIWSDIDYLRRQGSILKPLCRDAFGPGRHPSVDIEPFRDRFGQSNIPFQVDRDVVRAQLVPLFHHAPIFSGLPRKALDDIAAHGMTIDIETGQRLIHQGLVERELYIVLSGAMEVLHGDSVVRVLGPGEPIGEVAMLSQSGRRSATVRARTRSGLLVLNRGYVDSLVNRTPAMGARLLVNLARIMATRMSMIADEEQARARIMPIIENTDSDDLDPRLNRHIIGAANE